MPTEKPFVLQYYDASWGGWRDLPYDTLVNDDPAQFDSVEEGRTMAKSVTQRYSYRTRVRRRRDSVVVAEYRQNGARVT